MSKIEIILTCLFLTAAPLLSVPKEGREIPNKTDIKLLAETALKNKNHSVVVACYGMMFENCNDPGSDILAQTVIKLSKRKGLLHQATSIPSLYDVSKLIPKIVNHEDGELAARILATKAYQKIMFETGITRSAPVDDNDVKGKKKNKGKKAKRKAELNAGPGSIAIPETLFQSKNKTVQYLAILAAAYSAQENYANQIAKVEAKTGEIAAAKILFKVMTGDLPEDQEVVQAHKKCIRINKPVNTVSTILSEVDPNVPGLATLCEALGRTKDKKYLAIIHDAFQCRDERVRIDAVRAARKIADKSSNYPLLKMLDKAQWSTLIEICLFLGENPDRESIYPLIKRFKKETGRFRLDCNYALSSICGKRHGYKAEEWENWWQTNKKTFEVDPAKSAEYRSKVRLQDVGVPSNGLFYSILIYSDRCCFVVDYSKSMNGDKIADLKENAKETIQSLTDNVYFNVVEFGGDVNMMYDNALTDNKKKALTYIDSRPLTGGTRSMDAMERGVMIPEVDTIYFLSDGAPVRGQISDWLNIHKLVRLKNRYRHIAYSTICFKAGISNAFKMKDLADQNYGHTESIE